MSEEQTESNPTLSRDHEIIRAMTAEIRTLEEEKSRDEVDATVAIGHRLARVKARLAHGEWLPWLDESVPYGPSTASNYMALAAWSARRAKTYQELRHLGVGKLYLIVPLQKAELRKLRSKAHTIPRSGVKKSLEAMSVEDLRSLLASWLGPQQDTPERVVGQVKGTLTRLEKQAAAWLDLPDLDPEEALGLRARLAGIVGQIDERFPRAVPSRNA